ncbi:NADH-quinone oxidoreductase subunit N [Luteimicrobium sp. DT211]|uniref:NADH-quinone oxidoreductase subunit N n=1 Tax=Luteimicrobium sp. DT211 TaxID=3393412 RepID=UPI003CE7A8D1
MDYGALLPEIVLLGGAIVALLGGSFLPRPRQVLVTWFAIVVACLSAVTAALGTGPPTVFSDSYALDDATATIRILVPFATAVVMLIGRQESHGSARESETASLLLLAALGTIVLAGANDLLIVATGFLLATVPLYALIGLSRSAAAAEATMKTYLLGAAFGVVMLFGIAVLVGVAGGSTYPELQRELPHVPAAAVALGFVGVLAGLLFKAGAVPGHFWVPDAAEGAGLGVAAFITTVPKLGALVALARLVDVMPKTVDAPLLVGLLAAASMTLGTLAAFWQRSAPRLLGWSTVGQVGFLLMPVAVIGVEPSARPALLMYLVFYAVTNLALFAAIAALPNRTTIPAWRGAAKEHPAITGVMLVGLLSLVGTPPTAVFVGKLAVFTTTWQGGMPWLVVIAAAVSATSLFYALRWLSMAFQPAETPRLRTAAVQMQAATAVALGTLVIVAVVATPALLRL